MYNDVMGVGEKNPEKCIHKKENKEKIPIWFPSQSIRFGGRLFSGSKETGNKPDLP